MFRRPAYNSLLFDAHPPDTMPASGALLRWRKSGPNAQFGGVEGFDRCYGGRVIQYAGNGCPHPHQSAVGRLWSGRSQTREGRCAVSFSPP